MPKTAWNPQILPGEVDKQIAEIETLWDYDNKLSHGKVLVIANLEYLAKWDHETMRELVYNAPPEPIKEGDIVLCPPTPRGDGQPFEAMVVSLDASSHPYKGPCKTIIRKVTRSEQ